MRISDWSSDVCSSDLPDTFVFKVGDRVRDALGEGIIINHTCNALTVAFDNGGYRVCTPGDLLFVSRPEPHDVIPVSSETMAAIVRGDARNQAPVFKVSHRGKHATPGQGDALRLHRRQVLLSFGTPRPGFGPDRTPLPSPPPP